MHRAREANLGRARHTSREDDAGGNWSAELYYAAGETEELIER